MKTPGLMRPYMTKLAALYKLMDVLIIAGSYCYFSYVEGSEWNDKHSLGLILSTGVFYLSANANDLYRSWRISSTLSESFTIIRCWMISMAFFIAIGIPLGLSQQIFNPHMGLWLSVTPVLLCVWHFLTRLISREFRKRNYNTRKVAVIGATRLGLDISKTIHDATWMGLQFAGFYEQRQPHDNRLHEGIPTVQIQGSIDELLTEAKNGEIDLIIIALPITAHKRNINIIRALSDTTASVYLAEDVELYELLSNRKMHLGDIPMVAVYESPFNGIGGWSKLAEDILICIPILAIISIPCLIISILIKLDSPGPILFKQVRYGLNGKNIEVLKFRSMHYSSEPEKDVVQATQGDSRVTRVGRYLRKYSLDELPQFINVLRGEMSIVGPRPHAAQHNEQYRALVKAYMIRHKVKPGITGWAQINGFRGETDVLEKMEKRVEHDLYYINNWSVSLDLRIILMTVFKGFNDGNAY